MLMLTSAIRYLLARFAADLRGEELHRGAVEQLVKAGGKLVGFYGTMADGPGALTIVDVDPVVAAAITGTVASSDGVQNVKMMRLWSEDEIMAVRQKRIQLHGSYKAPGQ
jgi:hypothetical protein